MITRIRSSWTLVKQSCSVLAGNRRLLLFPLVNLAFTVAILLFFLAPLLVVPTGHPLTSAEHWTAIADQLFETSDGGSVMAEDSEGEWTYTPTFLVVAAVVYLVSMVVVTFLNTAFFSEILRALRGEAVSVRRGLAFALTRMRPILTWSLFAGVVGLILRQLESQLDIVGRWIVGLLGVVWSVASVFAIPVIIRDPEATNPLRVLKHSGRLIARRWGEGLVGYIGLSAVATLLILGLGLVIALAAWGAAAAGLDAIAALALALGLWLVMVLAVAYLMGVIDRIFQCALYVYAAEGSMPGPYDEAAAEAVWRVRKRRR